LYRGEEKVIEMVQYNYIRFLYFNKHESQRAIAKELGISRTTVRRAIANPEQGYHLTAKRVKPINGDFEDRIRYWVQYNLGKPISQRLTKKRMYELVREEGYKGNYSSFTYQTRKVEEEFGIGQKEAYLELVPVRGSLQVDFGEVYVMQKGLPKKLHVFCAKLCYSKVEFVKAYPAESTEFFFDGLVSTFSFLKHVPKKIIFDNLKPAVKKVLTGKERILQEAFLKFQSFYCFESEFCGPGKGNEKGMVENLVKYVENNYFLPRPEFTSFDTLNSSLLERCVQRLGDGRYDGKRWEERFAEEDFLPFEEEYKYARIKEVTVDTYQLVHLESNRYSVPEGYVGRTLEAHIYPFKVRIIHKGEVITEHERLFGRNKESLYPYHFLPLLRKKTRGYDQAKVIQEWRLPEIYEKYHKMLQAYLDSETKGTREFIDVLRLTQEYSVETIAKILKELDEKNRYSYQDVLSVLRYQTQTQGNKRQLSEEELESLNVSKITTTYIPLAIYNDLLHGSGVSEDE